METQFNVGDAIRIKYRHEMGTAGPRFGWNEHMSHWSDKKFVISFIERKPGRIERVYFKDMPKEMGVWKWSFDMIEKIDSEQAVNVSIEEVISLM